MFFTIVEGISIFVQTALGSMMVLLLAEGHDPLGFCHHEIAQHWCLHPSKYAFYFWHTTAKQKRVVHPVPEIGHKNSM